jgi:hypothetical protein
MRAAGLACAAVIGAGSATAAWAAPAEPSAQARRRAVERRRPVAEKTPWIGMRAIRVDERTGQLRRPTRAEATELAASLRALLDRSGASVRSELRSDGMRQAHLHGRFSNVVLSRPLADGTSETLCVNSFEEAIAFMGLRPESAGAAGALE